MVALRKRPAVRRLRTVILDLMYQVARWVRHERGFGLSFGYFNPWFDVWRRTYLWVCAYEGSDLTGALEFRACVGIGMPAVTIPANLKRAEVSTVTASWKRPESWVDKYRISINIKLDHLL